MSLVYKSLSVSCFNRQLQPQVTQHGPPGRAPPHPTPAPRQLLAGTDAQGHRQGDGSGGGEWRGGSASRLRAKCFRNREKDIRSGKLRRHETAAICGSTAQILVAFDTLLPSGKKIRAPFKNGDRGGRVSRAHGWYFLRLDIEKKITVHTQRRAVKCET